MNTLTLFELNSLVRQTLELTICEEYWVCAEISELRVNRHCYMELVQKDMHGNGIIAKARAQVWSNRWSLIKAMFESVTQQTLRPGMQVLVKAEITFHEIYGYSLNITDIDPTYTLGDMAKRRMEIMRRLEEEGISDMNKELQLPRLLQRIAIISSASAAGYGDFCNQLKNNPEGLAFKTQLFQATMQGNDVTSSIIAALNAIAAHLDDWDAVIIIRGGGATSDLSGFDTLELTENVAQFPLPIITGIGHERDDTIIDLIAHTRVKTPTAAAEFLIRHQKEELDLLESINLRISNSISNLLLAEHTRLKLLANKIPSLFSMIRKREEIRIDRFVSMLGYNSLRYIDTKKNDIIMLNKQRALYTQDFLKNKKIKIEFIENKLKNSNPERILKLGFSIARINGKAIRNIQDVKEGDSIETTLASGTIKSTVTWKRT
ncbi:MAG: exodeoxyribonuclease VII large subunit [Bacteroidaceae bacterium]|nr:exodeoxyribonuclease VII large subunit [Bacteroidaceae bacterium]